MPSCVPATTSSASKKRQLPTDAGDSGTPKRARYGGAEVNRQPVRRDVHGEAAGQPRPPIRPPALQHRQAAVQPARPEQGPPRLAAGQVEVQVGPRPPREGAGRAGHLRYFIIVIIYNFNGKKMF